MRGCSGQAVAATGPDALTPGPAFCYLQQTLHTLKATVQCDNRMSHCE